MAQLVQEWDDERGAIQTLAPGYARISGCPLRVPHPAPKPGAQTRNVLLEHGFEQGEIDRMISDGTAAEQLCDAYLPP